MPIVETPSTIEATDAAIDAAVIRALTDEQLVGFINNLLKGALEQVDSRQSSATYADTVRYYCGTSTPGLVVSTAAITSISVSKAYVKNLQNMWRGDNRGWAIAQTAAMIVGGVGLAVGLFYLAPVILPLIVSGAVVVGTVTITPAVLTGIVTAVSTIAGFYAGSSLGKFFSNQVKKRNDTRKAKKAADKKNKELAKEELEMQALAENIPQLIRNTESNDSLILKNGEKLDRLVSEYLDRKINSITTKLDDPNVPEQSKDQLKQLLKQSVDLLCFVKTNNVLAYNLVLIKMKQDFNLIKDDHSQNGLLMKERMHEMLHAMTALQADPVDGNKFPEDASKFLEDLISQNKPVENEAIKLFLSETDKKLDDAQKKLINRFIADPNAVSPEHMIETIDRLLSEAALDERSELLRYGCKQILEQMNSPEASRILNCLEEAMHPTKELTAGSAWTPEAEETLTTYVCQLDKQLGSRIKILLDKGLINGYTDAALLILKKLESSKTLNDEDRRLGKNLLNNLKETGNINAYTEVRIDDYCERTPAQIIVTEDTSKQDQVEASLKESVVEVDEPKRRNSFKPESGG